MRHSDKECGNLGFVFGRRGGQNVRDFDDGDQFFLTCLQYEAALGGVLARMCVGAVSRWCGRLWCMVRLVGLDNGVNG